ncbi:phosphohistidine phosphatase SixA [Aliiglaciecola sp. CAU 1673]|uniref:phosphohistidine phosphatase SixA n=1 Tax=Aliiglaciecola sp. CAU 1673 TaxID=3032595 RepID=UPI0023DC15CF|nr:phosphohistidine phosphatase SixA [Aliiglaciecola sp. CAU 1673]MDF2177128.1 phosphohistidine phosphatase SixA [Aliiglaciecola sp. CAU 1673]
MQLFIMRHGEAEHNMFQDAARKLTLVGQDESRKAGEWLRSRVPELDLVLVSPYVRAKQTLSAVTQGVTVGETVETSEITPGGEVVNFHQYLDALCAARINLNSVLLVSHMPFVSALVDELCGHFYSLLFATASVVQLDYDPTTGRASLTRQFTPD